MQAHSIHQSTGHASHGQRDGCRAAIIWLVIIFANSTIALATDQDFYVIGATKFSPKPEPVSLGFENLRDAEKRLQEFKRDHLPGGLLESNALLSAWIARRVDGEYVRWDTKAKLQDLWQREQWGTRLSRFFGKKMIATGNPIYKIGDVASLLLIPDSKEELGISLALGGAGGLIVGGGKRALRIVKIVIPKVTKSKMVQRGWVAARVTTQRLRSTYNAKFPKPGRSIPNKFDRQDLLYGPNSNNRLRNLADLKGTQTLDDLDKPTNLDWFEFSRTTIEQQHAAGRKIWFDLSHMEDLENVVNGIGKHRNRVTTFELRYIRDNWERLKFTVRFIKNGKHVLPPWVQ